MSHLIMHRIPTSADHMSMLLSGSTADGSAVPYSRSQARASLVAFDHTPLHTYDRGFPSRTGFVDDVSQDNDLLRTISGENTRYTKANLHQTISGYPGPGDQPPQSEYSYPSSVMIEHDDATRRYSYDSFGHHTDSPASQDHGDYEWEEHRKGTDNIRGGRYHTRKRPLNPDEFDGPSQYLPLPLPQQDQSRIQELVKLPIHLTATEQDEILRRMNDILAECAFHFVAKYQFPIPLERSKPRVRSAADREWAEWAHLIKRLATKRRIPARVLYDNQIRQLVTTLEHSILPRRSNPSDKSKSMRAAHDDRYILQLLSAATQVAKLLMDSLAMQQLNDLYSQTENVIMNRRHHPRALSGAF